MRRKIPAIQFRQWLTDWNDVVFDKSVERSRPDENILLFSMKANELRALSEPFRRKRERSADVAEGIQRNLDLSRSELIRDYVRYGYPYSEMSTGRRAKFDLGDLRKPGWLPTAIIVNILKPEDVRRTRSVAAKDIIEVGVENGLTELTLPENFAPEEGWKPESLPSMEIIDGQHRLFAFDAQDDLPGDFELPVVAFHGLDLGWQAYLFWTINISPKKINRSHAFDLYPLLRTQDWLEKFDEAVVYREARAQEITELLYSHPDSVWRDRINMLGEGRDRGRVSQAGWIRSLIGTVLSPKSKANGGIFGANLGTDNQPLPWSRAQQAAFLIAAWEEMSTAISNNVSDWSNSIRNGAVNDADIPAADPAFKGNYTLLNQEQGIRGVLTVVNDYFAANSDAFELDRWIINSSEENITSIEAINEALVNLRDQPAFAALRNLMVALSDFDWRSSDAPGLDEGLKRSKQAYRGSSGYGVLRSDLYSYLANVDGDVGEVFAQLSKTGRT